MNVATKSPDGHYYYVFGVRRGGQGFGVVGKHVDSGGAWRQVSHEVFATRKEAEAKCRRLSNMKVKKRGFLPVEISHLPQAVQERLEPDLDMQLTPEDMVELLYRSKMERYVVFENLDGLEGFFDLGVEYLGYQVDGDFLEVHDKFGELRVCFASRMSSVEPTERAVEVGG
jgi:hypothetical protein